MCHDRDTLVLPLMDAFCVCVWCVSHAPDHVPDSLAPVCSCYALHLHIAGYCGILVERICCWVMYTNKSCCCCSPLLGRKLIFGLWQISQHWKTRKQTKFSSIWSHIRSFCLVCYHCYGVFAIYRCSILASTMASTFSYSTKRVHSFVVKRESLEASKCPA